MHPFRSLRFLPAAFCMLIVAGGLTLGGCSDHAGSEPGAAAEGAGGPSMFTGSGRLRTAPPGGRFVRLEHGDIPGFMAAMTMVFELADSSLVRGISVGDSVQFDVTVEAGAAVVTDVRRVAE